MVQAVGKTSRQMASLETGDRIAGLLGPLGRPAAVQKFGLVLCVAGGVGTAELLPVARVFREAGNHVTALCGARSTAHMILDQELRSTADEVLWSTDDSSGEYHGTVVDLMRAWKSRQPDAPAVAHVIGPIPMMRAAAQLTREWGVPTFASLNPIMVDGTGMCGGCRVAVGGKARFACVDGPEFDAHQVDFDELARRNRAYLEQEASFSNNQLELRSTKCASPRSHRSGITARRWPAPVGCFVAESLSTRSVSVRGLSSPAGTVPCESAEASYRSRRRFVPDTTWLEY